MEIWLLFGYLLYIIFVIGISLIFYLKYKLVPAIYYIFLLLLIYLIPVIIVFKIANTMKKGFVVLLICLLLLVLFVFFKVFKSVKKNIKLQLNRKLLLTGTKIKINNLKLELRRPLKELRLGCYYGTYKGKDGKKYIFESEDYLKIGSGILLINNKDKNKKNQIVLYVDPNNEKNYYYKISDFN